MLTYFFNVYVLCGSDFNDTCDIFVDGYVFVLEKSRIIVGELKESFFDSEEFLDGEFELFGDVE